MSNEMKDWQRDRNIELIEKYPFLLPRNRWTGEVVKDYDYEYTELDDMPDGWRFTFGEQMCEEIKEVLVREGALDMYRIEQIKEKFGGLRWYDNFAVSGVVDLMGGNEIISLREKVSGARKEIYDIIRKYEDLSYKTCINCGEPATQESLGWISPYCDKCTEKLAERGVQFKPIEAE